MSYKAQDIFERNMGRFVVGNCALFEKPNDEHFADIVTLSQSWGGLSDLVGSPIEAIMAAELIFLEHPYGRVSWVNAKRFFRGPFKATLSAQASILTYRADFVITISEGDLSHSIVIECDGHNFHEKTKEQAAKDKSRDRAMTLAGHHVIRFTGSEIYRASDRCVGEVAALLERLVDDLGARSGVFSGVPR